MSEEGAGIGGADSRQGGADSGGDAVPGACPDPTQVLLGLGKGLLDGAEIGRVGGQEDEVTSGRLDARSGFGALVHAEVIQNHNLAWSKCRNEHPLYEGLEDQPIDSTPDQQAFAQSMDRQRRQPGDGLPPSAWNPPMCPLAAGGSRPQGCQGRRRTRFIEKEEVGWIDVRHRGAPGGARRLVPLDGDQTLFLSRRPSLAKSRLRCEGLRETPVAAASRAACSGKVASGCAKTSSRNCS